ncbi:MAG: hypothetical protein LBR15_01845 [Methanobrevibacter sp.]|nr:hypothetical protein [Candidatus Methanovirga australis]
MSLLHFLEDMGIFETDNHGGNFFQRRNKRKEDERSAINHLNKERDELYGKKIFKLSNTVQLREGGVLALRNNELIFIEKNRIKDVKTIFNEGVFDAVVIWGFKKTETWVKIYYDDDEMLEVGLEWDRKDVQNALDYIKNVKYYFEK